MTQDIFSEVALVSVSKQSGTEMDFYTICDSVDFKIGQKDVDFVATLAGGRLANFKPMEPTEVTLKLYPLEVGTDSGSTGKGVFDLFCSGTSDSTQPLSFTVDRDHTKYRVTFLLTDDTTITSAVSDVGLNQIGARLIAKNGYLVEATPSEYTPESGWVWTARFKFSPFDKDGNGNITGQSTDGTATMTMTAAYT
ncbi:hypothetical protein DRN69_05140 [Candidatus Pacearchaeota archaeon]|nr:MAG: hypothetical protein DRN69_05140 [Candidatus Pacearchaeota archaeon]